MTEVDESLCRLIGYRIKFQSEEEMFTLFKSKTNSVKDYDLELENMKSMIKLLKKFQAFVSKLKNMFPYVRSELENAYSSSHPIGHQ